MPEKTAKTIRKIYGIVLTVSIMITGLCFMACSAHIYLTGDRSYSAVKVAAYFSMISIPVYLCMTLIAGSFLLALLLPDQEKEKPAKIPAYMLLARTKQKVLHSESDLLSAIAAEETGRQRRRNVLIVVLSLCFGVFLAYGLNPVHFNENINASVLRGVLVLLICLTAPLTLVFTTVYQNQASIERETQLRKQAQTSETIPPLANNHLPLTIARLVICLLAVALVVIGISGQGTVDVLTKAINICTECIGLG